MICQNCKTTVVEGISICGVCDFPVGGSEQEQSLFIARQSIAKVEVKDSKQKIKNARWVLLFVGAFYVIIPFTPLLLNNNIFITVLSVLIGGFFLTFGLLSYKIPKVAFLIPLILILLYNLLILFLNPAELMNGLLWRLVIIIGVGYGYFSATRASKLLKKHQYLVSVLANEEKTK